MGSFLITCFLLLAVSSLASRGKVGLSFYILLLHIDYSSDSSSSIPFSFRFFPPSHHMYYCSDSSSSLSHFSLFFSSFYYIHLWPLLFKFLIFPLSFRSFSISYFSAYYCYGSSCSFSYSTFPSPLLLIRFVFMTMVRCANDKYNGRKMTRKRLGSYSNGSASGQPVTINSK